MTLTLFLYVCRAGVGSEANPQSGFLTSATAY